MMTLHNRRAETKDLVMVPLSHTRLCVRWLEREAKLHLNKAPLCSVRADTPEKRAVTLESEHPAKAGEGGRLQRMDGL